MRKNAAAGLLALVILTLTACGSPAPASTAAKGMTIRYGGQIVPPDLVYQGKDWGAKYNLKVQTVVFPNSGAASEALLADQVDIGNAGAPRAVSLLAANPDKFWLLGAYQFGGDTSSISVKKDSAYQKIEDLLGKKIAVQNGSGTLDLFEQYMTSRQWTPKDFQLINMTANDMSAAVAQGTVDAMAVWEPTPAIAEARGLTRRLFSFKDVATNPIFFVVSKKYAAAHPDAVIAFLASWLDCKQLISQNPDEAGKLAAQMQAKSGASVAPEALKLALQRSEFNPDISDQLWKDEKAVAAGLLKTNKIKAMPDLDSARNATFMEKAKALSGWKG